MPHIQQITQTLKAKIAAHRGTPEQIEQARRKAMQNNTICQPGCPICGGIGYIKDERGRVSACPNVSSRVLYPGERYGLSQAERDLSWEQIGPANGVESAVAAVQQALERGSGWVYLWGPPGLAKTLVLKIAVAVSLEAHRAAAYTRMVEILDDMRAAFDANNPSFESQRRLDWWAELPVLAIDEFDRLRSTAYAAERRFLLMDRRYENAFRSTSITLMAANEDPALLDGYLYDRIRDGRFSVVHLTGSSLRPAMEWDE